MFKKLKNITKINLLVTISVCASALLGAAFVYCVWNWLAPEFLQLPAIPFANCVSIVTALADICMFEIQILYKTMQKDKKKKKNTKRKKK